MKIEIHLFMAFIILCTSISHSSKLPDKNGRQAQTLELDAVSRSRSKLPPHNPREPRNPEQPPHCPPEGCK
ncbi:hypothetical protein O181_036641 [Austropuccinia psidii MF-1]|uniref:Secreted protein n=1 Tax=Austropuccinia psidii MF-1 TaxID=1389203 RepID=A0A9Q3DAK5_9BASI|nr:hypothetical protein [Austropuccinia psidii MF-1]